MTYASILVQLDEHPASARRAVVAARLAARCGAALTGVFIQGPFPFQYFTLEEGEPRPADLTRLATAHDTAQASAAARAHQMFREATQSHEPLGAHWLEIPGDNARPMLEHMRLADLTILSRDHTPNGGDSDLTASALGLACGGPVLVLPDATETPAVGRRVLVAWDGGREASRALRDAWPFLKTADKIFALTVGSSHDAGPRTLLEEAFRVHGCDVEWIADHHHNDAVAGHAILDQAAKLDADLIVMGLYGHVRLLELLMGGVSREVMARSPVPLLVSH
jgi:nucleotide-binding universal stress UspA family protein